jgi:hypothetical protein
MITFPKSHDLSHLVDSRIGVPASNPNNLFDEGKGTYDIDIEEWSTYGTNTVERVVEDGETAVKISYIDHPFGANLALKETGNLSTNLVIGRAYRVRVRAKSNTGNVDLQYFVGSGWTDFDGTPTDTEFNWFEAIFISSTTDGGYIAGGSMSGSEVLWISEVQLFEWDGEELVPDHDVGFVANDVSKWSEYGTNVIEQDGNAVKCTYVDNASGQKSHRTRSRLQHDTFTRGGAG